MLITTPKFGGLCADSLEHLFTLNKLIFNCKLFTNIYLDNNEFNIIFDIIQFNIILHFIQFNITYIIALGKVSGWTISTSKHNRKINLIFKFNFRTIRSCISITMQTNPNRDAYPEHMQPNLEMHLRTQRSFLHSKNQSNASNVKGKTFSSP